MNRRDFFRWLAAASGVALVEPGLVLGATPSSFGDVLEPENEIWAWLHPQSMSSLVSFDVLPDRDTVLVLANDDPRFAIAIGGFAAFVGHDQVIVESIMSDGDGYDRIHSPFDLVFFRTDECYCPFDGGLVRDGRSLRIRLSPCTSEIVRIGLAVITSPIDLTHPLGQLGIYGDLPPSPLELFGVHTP